MSVFHRTLANNFLANITNYTEWFAIAFWVFLETGSVFATGMIAGIFLTFTGLLGIWLGALVDHHGQIAVMSGSSLVSLIFFALSFGLMQVVPEGAFANSYGIWLWALVLLGHVRCYRRPYLQHRLADDGDAADPRRRA